QVVNSPSGDVLRGATISRVADDLIAKEMAGIDRMEALLIPPISECLHALPETLHGFVDWEILLPDTIKADNDIATLLTKKVPRIQTSSGRVCASLNPRGAFISRIALAGEALLKRRIEGVVVACADSLCDTARLNKLMLDGRLKDPDNPYGILAGEAGGAVLLERESAARFRKVPILAAISAWGSATEPHPWPDGKPSKALGLTTAFHQAFAKLDDRGASVVQVITDENGERARSLEWSLTAGRIFPNPDQERYLWHPAVVTGDTGGSLGAVVLADAIMRLILSTPPSGRVALAVSDDQGSRQVLCLEHVDQPEREEYFAMIRSTIGCRVTTTEKQ
ncbi:MAG: 3-oxoacyl-ACP synthase, partial [Bacteroidota bacterium]|nr:3-oxoacyl-ACP synthase [Bacteroidota bacterium]